MTIYNLYIFNKHCNCIYFQEWNTVKPTNSRRGSTTTPPSQTQLQQDKPITTLQASTIQMISTPSQAYKNNVTQSDIKHIPKQVEEDSKLVYGIVFSLKNIINKLKPMYILFKYM